MTTTTRFQKIYDHRLKDLVRETGDIQPAVQRGVPRSTAQGWLCPSRREVVTLTDYRLLTNMIHSNFDEATIQGNRLHHLYVRARGWESVIRDTTTVYDCSWRCAPVTMKDRVPGEER